MMEKCNLDEVLNSVGSWGRFQKLSYLALCSVIIFSVFPMSYIFTARDIKYRCKIDQCEHEQTTEYNPTWLKNAVPFHDDEPNRCLYYEFENNCTNFNKSSILTCNNFVYERNETTIVHDFHIVCDENLWKLTTVGTVNVIGELFCLPFAGFISDRFGRKAMVLVSVILSTIVGLIRSFAVNYYMYISLEFLDTALGAGMYSGAFILALELVDSKRRNLGNTIICCAFASGQVFLATVAWISPTWRIMLRVLYSFGAIVILPLWFLPESVRWLISKNKIHEARTILKQISKMNGKKLNDEDLLSISGLNASINEEDDKTQDDGDKVPILKVLRTKALLIRTIHCSFTWICCNFPYYGLTIQSVALSEDIYVNFMCTAIVEVPAYLITYGSIDRLGRRKTLAFSLILAGLACFCVEFVKNENDLVLVVFLSGKFFITMAYTTLYIYTAEMFPTSSRHSTFAICSMFGRLGSMVAPQVPLLARVFRSLPLIIFSAMTLTSGLLAFWFPETHNTKLPDEIYEAVNIAEEP